MPAYNCPHCKDTGWTHYEYRSGRFISNAHHEVHERCSCQRNAPTEREWWEAKCAADRMSADRDLEQLKELVAGLHPQLKPEFVKRYDIEEKE